MNRPVAVVLAALSGFIALSYELLWYRVVSFTSGSAAPAFSLLLGLYLLGLAIGAELVSKVTRSQEDSDHLSGLALLVLGANIAGFLTVPMMAVFIDAGAPLILASVVVIVAAALLGTQFPLICHLAFGPDDDVGASLSYLYAANIVGSASGSLVTGLWLMGTFLMSTITLGLMLLGVVIYAVLDRQRTIGRRAAFSAIIAVVAIAICGPLYDGVWVDLMAGDDEPNVTRVIETKSSVLMIRDNDEVWGNTVYDGTFSVDLADDRNGVIRPYSLSLFHPKPKRVLVAGLATGSWASVVAHHPDVEEVVIVEINEGQLQLREQFEQLDDLLDDPKVTVVIDDVRRYMLRSHEKFDAIVCNTTYNWRAYASALLSEEFFRIAARSLTDNGVVIINTTMSAGAMKAAQNVFADIVLWTNAIVAGPQLDYDVDRWMASLRRYQYGGQPLFDPTNPEDEAALEKLRAFAANPKTKDCELTLRQVCKDEGLEKLLADVAPITDDNTGSEWWQLRTAFIGHRPEK